MAKTFISDEEIWALLRKLTSHRSKVISYTMNPIGENPMGFLGNHFLFIMNYCEDYQKDSQHLKTIKFFMKTTPHIASHAQYVENIGVFKKEVILFNTLIPKLLDATAFLENPWAPKCHIAKENMLLLENLTEKNYRLANQVNGIFDLEHCVAVMRTLADFHAASVIFEHTNPSGKCNINEMCPEAVEEACYNLKEGHSRNDWLKSTTEGIVHLCKQMGRGKQSELLPKLIRATISNVGPSPKWCNVLSHGDLWANNFMFNYDKHGNIKHCIIVDYQLARYAPCALDLMCCLHLIAPRKLRDSHMVSLLNSYYNRLCSVLKLGGLNPEDIIPLEEFEEGCNQYKQLGVVEACLFGTIIWIPANLAAEIMSDPERCMELAVGSRVSVVEQAFKEDTFFKHHMTDLIEELLDMAVPPVISY